MGTQHRFLIATFMLATLASGIIAWEFIFPVPALFCAVLLVVLAGAYWTSRSAPVG
jgi:hypothetical protein